MPAPY